MPKFHETIESMRPDMAKRVERLYEPLIRQLNLTPEQSKKFYQLQIENKLSDQAQRADLLRHENIAKFIEQATSSRREMEAGILALLGDTNFAQYQKYQARIADRSKVEMMKNAFAKSPLTEEQQQHLLDAMDAGRNQFDDGNSNSSSSTGFSIGDDRNVMDQKLARQESINQYVLERAAAFLSPEQLQILAPAQARMLKRIEEGYLQMREMFGASDKPASK